MSGGHSGDEDRTTARRTTSANTLRIRDWAVLAKGIRDNNDASVKHFYDVFNAGFRLLIKRQLGESDLEDSVHDCVLAVIMAVRGGTPREPERCVGFVNTIVKRHIAHKIVERVARRAEEDIELVSPLRSSYPSPEAQAMKAEARSIARLVLDSLSDRDRDVLRRFYLLGQTEDQIRGELELSYQGFKNIKHRAKNKFVEHWHRRAGSDTEGRSPRGRF
jgi:RNA polymerase sigma-70 factor (ECF subfamily)